VAFPRTTLLGAYGYRTRGADVCSPANQYLHPLTLYAYPEMIKLSVFTGDPYYGERAEEQRVCHLQLLAREEGDFGARRGMSPGQIHHTDWAQPKGRTLQLSHSGVLGAILYANLMARLAERPDAVPGEPPAEPKGDEQPMAGPLDRPWALADHRETREIPVKWKIF
jgi:hypothetical protein